MNSSRQTAAGDNPHRWLEPATLARLSNLELVAKAVVDGFFTGMHRSPYFGFSQEFAEYKAYNDGDDPRFIDWNVYARTDRTYIKRFLGETNTALNLLIDVSGSMSYRSADVSKLQYAKFLSATLAYLARKQHDAIGVTLFDDRIREVMPPASHPDTLYRLLAMLDRTQAGEGTEIHDSLQHIAGTVTRRGILVVMSDFYCDPETLGKNLLPLVNRGHEVVLFQLLDAGELTPGDTLKSMRSPATLKDLESDGEIKVTAEFMRDEYPARIAAHIEALKTAANRYGFTHVLSNTAKPLDDMLQHYLTVRQQQR